VAGSDFIVNITGNVTGFDVAPITNLNNAIKQLPPSTQSAAAGGQQLSSSLNTTAGSANSLTGPLNTVRTSAQTTGQSFGSAGPLANAFGANLTRTGSAAGGLINPLNLVRTTTQATGQGFTASGALANNYGTVLVGTSGKAQQLVGAHGALGNSFSPVQGGLTSTNTLLQTHSTALGTASTKSQETQQSTIGLGEKIGLLGGFITTTVGTVFGLVEGFTGLEAAQVAADRAQQRVNTSTLAAQKAQDAYSKQVIKFGPDSRQAQEALINIQNKQEAVRIAQDRANVTQSRLNEAYVSFGSEVITVAGELAQMGSTVAILVGKLGGHAAAAALSADASAAEGIAAGEAAIGLDAEGFAAGNSAKGTEAASLATKGLGLSFLAIAVPVVAAVALFALIETNTFKMGDAFRATVTVIGSGVDAIINAVTGLKNNVVGMANQFEVFKAEVNNIFVDIYNSIARAFNSIIAAAITFNTGVDNAFIGIYNFVVDHVANPIIGAWNTLLKTIGEAVAAAVGPITSAWNSVLKGIVDLVVTAVGKVNDFLGLIHVPKIDMTPITDLQAHLKDTGTVSTDLKTKFDAAFVPSPGIDKIKTQVVGLTGEFIPLSGAYVNTTTAAHTYDAALGPLNSTIGKSAAATVAYYSEQKNLQSAVQNQVIPAISNLIAPVTNAAGAMINGAKAANESDASHKKLNTTLAAAAKAHKDLGTALQDSISKTLQETQATAQNVIQENFRTKALADTAKALTDAAAKEQTLTTELTNATAIRNRYNTAIIEGTNKYLELVTKTQDAVVTQNQYNSILTQATSSFVLFNGAIEKTPKNMDLVAKAALGDQDALKQLQDQVNSLYDDFNKLGDQIGSKLGDAMEKGGKDFKKALKDLAKETGISFDDMKHDMSFKVAAGMAEAKKTLSDDLGVMNLLVRNNSPKLASDTEQMIGGLTHTIEKAGGQITPQWQKIFDDMRTIASQPIDSAAATNALGDIQTQLKAMGVSAPEVNKIVSQLSGNVGGLGTAAAGTQGPMDQFNSSVQQAGTLGSVWQITLQNIIAAFNTGFKAAVGDATGSLIALETSAADVFTNISNALVVLAQNFNSAFQQAVAAASGALVTLEQNAATAFTNITNALVVVATNFKAAFDQGVNAAALAINNLVKLANTDFQTIITGTNAVAAAMIKNFDAGVNASATALNNLTTNANGNFASIIKGTTAVATALSTNFSKGAGFAAGSMNALASNVASNVNTMISRLNNVISEFNNITSSINRSKSAVDQLKADINSIPTNRTVNVNIVEHITQQVRQVPVLASVGASIASAGLAGTAPAAINTAGTTTTTTTLTAGRATASRRVTVEVREPTIVKIGDREFLKFINRKLLELDLGAIS
jgi:hypothetical protein